MKLFFIILGRDHAVSAGNDLQIASAGCRRIRQNAVWHLRSGERSYKRVAAHSTAWLRLSLACVLVGCGQVLAGNVTLTTAGGSQFVRSNGGALTNGCAVRIGTFSLPSATRDQTLATTKDYAQLKALFKPLAEGQTGSGTPLQAGGTGSLLRTNSLPGAGDVFGTISNLSASYMAPGTQLYAWVFDNADPAKSSQWGIFTAASWLAPQALGSTALATTTALQSVQGSAVEGQLRLTEYAKTYGNWSWKQFAADAPSSMTHYAADADGDGISNLAEYVWKLNPNAHDTMPTTLSADAATGGTTFTFKVPLHLTDVTVTVECSTDLKTWSPAASTVIATDADFETRTCTAAPGPRCYWRVRFSSVATF